MKPTQMKPCCPKFQGFTREFIDLAADNDRSARMVANLLLSADYEKFDFQQLPEIGYFFETYLNRKVVQEHVFFGRHPGDCTFSDSDLSAEIQRVYAKVPKSKGGVA